MKQEEFKVGQIVWHKHHNEFVTISREPYVFRNIGLVVDIIYNESGVKQPLVPIGAFSDKLLIPSKYKDLVEFTEEEEVAK